MHRDHHVSVPLPVARQRRKLDSRQILPKGSGTCGRFLSVAEIAGVHQDRPRGHLSADDHREHALTSEVTGYREAINGWETLTQATHG